MLFRSAIRWIDKETGVIVKEEFKDKAKKEIPNGFYDNCITECNYSYEFDSVKDEDIARPDLEMYPDYTIENEVYNSIYF